MTRMDERRAHKIGEAEELELASLRRDGTLRNPVTIWVVRHGGDLYVWSVKGRTGPSFRGTQSRQKAGIWAGGVEEDVELLGHEGLSVGTSA
jgi:hypothetical protein